jgi:mannose-6-phosphate isomerase
VNTLNVSASSSLAPFRLRPTFSERPWGRRNLSPWYTSQQTGETKEPIGEAWLTGPQATAETGTLAGKSLAQIAEEYTESLLGEWREEGEFPLLLKLLFPDDKLSVQVHPDDVQAHAIGQRRGKTECWYTLAAKPGATVACGLKPGVTAEQIRASVADNSMEQLLNHIELHVGDMVFVDAGTVHAIGPGLTLLETQQTSDITYRMYDYGRPRELHLEQGINVTRTQTAAGPVKPELLSLKETQAQGTRLIQQRYFTVDRFDIPSGTSLPLDDAAGKPHCIVALSGSASLRDLAGNTVELLPGTATVIPASTVSYTINAGTDFACVRSMP